jgi:anti-sigma-K factor RskA
MPADFENHVIDLLPAYTLDILTDEETSLVAEHLTGCQTCPAEYQRLQLVADELPLALVQTAPPARVKDALMGSIHAHHIKPIPASRPTTWQKLTDILRLRFPALVVALILVLSFGNLLLWRQLNLSNSQTTSPMRVLALANTNNAPQALGTLVVGQSGDYGSLVVDHLQTLDNAHQYQVWLNRDGERISAGTFSVNHEGYASLELKAPIPLILYDTIGITVEPTGGSPGPTGIKVLGGDITH